MNNKKQTSNLIKLENIEQLKRFHASHKIITMLSESKSNIEFLVDHLPDLFAIIDLNGNIYRGNHRLSELFNNHIENLLGENFCSLFSKKHWEIFKSKISMISQINPLVEFELNSDSNSANTLDVNWRVAEFKTLSNKSTLFSVMGTDITTLRTREIELKKITLHLQDLVDEKTYSIKKILNAIDQGIITINLDFRINPIHSKYAEVIFATNDFSNKSLKNFLQVPSKIFDQFVSWLELFKDPSRLRRWDKYKILCPLKEHTLHIEKKKKYLKIDYKPIIKNDVLSQLMLIFTDISEKIYTQKKLEEIKKNNHFEMQRVLGIIDNQQTSISIFFEETTKTAAYFDQAQSHKDLEKFADHFFMESHTLKGNAGYFGFEKLSSIAHDLESFLTKLIHKNNSTSHKKSFNHWIDLKTKLRTELSNLIKIKDKIYFNQRDNITLNNSITNLINELETGKHFTNKEMIRRLKNITEISFKDFCIKYSKVVKDYQEESQKNISELIIETPNKLMSQELIRKFDAPVLHIIRNALDHGMEKQRNRKSTKQELGRIQISYLENSNKCQITITDNGKGIDPEMIAQKAYAKGLITRDELKNMSKLDKFELLFISGFSTQDKVSSMSGRGVGLAAARENLRNFGGDLKIKSKLGCGTSFVLTLPKKT